MLESRETELIKAIIDNLDDSETEYTKTPQSRNEEILVSILNETEYTKTPQSREEELLLELKEKIGGLVPPVPPVIKRVTGNPIEFENGADAPLVKCTTAIQGNQDLHGYDKPWVGGAGKNKLPLALSDIKNIQSPATSEGSWSGDSYVTNGVTFKINTDNAGNVTSILATGSTQNDNATLVLYGTNVTSAKDIVFSQPFIVSDGANGSATTFRGIVWGTEGAFIDAEEVSFNAMTVYGFGIRIMAGYTLPFGGVMFYPMIRLSTVSDATFAPYSNICPITAYNESTISGVGKNKAESFYVGTTLSRYSESLFFEADLKPSTTYTVSFKTTSAGNIYYSNETLCTFKTLIVVNGYNKITVKTVSNISKSNATQYKSGKGWSFLKNHIAETASINFSEVMVVEGSTDSPYEPYKGTTHTATFSQSIYQGNADFVGGTVGAGNDGEEWIVKDLGDYTWSKGGTNRFYTAEPLAKYPSSASIVGDIISEWYDAKTANETYSGVDGISIGDSSGVAQIHIYDSTKASMTAEQFKTAVTGCKVAFVLADNSPQQITVSNLPLKSLFGYNHIESSTGDMVVDYITDAYQNFVDTVESALPSNTRNLLSASKGGTKAMDIFLSLENWDAKEEVKEEDGEDKKEVDEIQNGVKEEIMDDR